MTDDIDRECAEYERDWAVAFDANGKPLAVRRVQLDDACTVGMAVRIAKAIVREERLWPRCKRWLAKARTGRELGQSS